MIQYFSVSLFKPILLLVTITFQLSTSNNINVEELISTFSENDDWDSTDIQMKFENSIRNIGIAQWEMPNEDKLLYDAIIPFINSFFVSTSNWSISIEDNSATIPINDDIDLEFWQKTYNINYGFIDRIKSTIPVQAKWFAIPFMQQNNINFMQYKSNPFKNNQNIIKFGNNMIKHCDFILSKIFQYLSLNSSHISYIMGDNPSKHLLFSYYDPFRINNDIAKYGLMDHNDFGFITLFIPNSNGLQFKYNDNWIDIPFSDNKYIINFGKLFNVTLNKQIKSTLHRVKVIETKARTTISMFYDPDLNGNIYKYNKQNNDFIFIKTMKQHLHDSFKHYYVDKTETEDDAVHDEL